MDELTIKQICQCLAIIDSEMYRRRIVFKNKPALLMTKIREMEFVKDVLNGYLAYVNKTVAKQNELAGYPTPLEGQGPLFDLPK